ncbi:MAG: L-lactate dehydrogenase [Candidatus Ratteibacteria bacterium]|nr:L-lactate dehydrogenase [Candidatus Ratteibacteria bacterium]
MQNLSPKISIVGCGNVGMRYAYALVLSGLARQIVLIDKDRKRIEGEVLDLSHTAPYVSPVEIIAGDYSDTKDSNLVVITAGKKQEVGQSRLDLVKDNVEIFKKIIPEIVKHSPNAILLIVTNPVDILSYAAYKLSSKPSKEVIGSGTVLDTARFRFLIAKHCGVDPHNVHAYILGEHGDSEFPMWSKAMIGGILFKEYCPMCSKRDSCPHNKQLNDIFFEVKNSAYEIIEKKGETSHGIGLALVRITRAILHDENAILPVSSLIDGYLGINEMYLSLPSIVNKNGVQQVLWIKLVPEEEQAFKTSAEAIKKVIKNVI